MIVVRPGLLRSSYWAAEVWSRRARIGDDEYIVVEQFAHCAHHHLRFDWLAHRLSLAHYIGPVAIAFCKQSIDTRAISLANNILVIDRRKEIDQGELCITGDRNESGDSCCRSRRDRHRSGSRRG